MRAPENAAPAPPVGAAARRTRSLVAVIVVLASAVTGYVCSRVWPLSMFSSITQLVDTGGNTGIAGAEFREAGPPPSPQASSSIPATKASASLDASSQSVRAVGQHLPETVRYEADGSSPAGQARADERRTPTTDTTSGKNGRPAAARRWAPSATASRVVRRQRTGGAQPSVVEFAPNPKPNQALRNFMTGPASN
jgi:hypothetical protein